MSYIHSYIHSFAIHPFMKKRKMKEKKNIKYMKPKKKERNEEKTN